MPVGTVITDSETGEVIADLDTDGKRCADRQGRQRRPGQHRTSSPAPTARPRQNTPGRKAKSAN
jgi:GTP-binding protein